MLTLATLGCYI